MHCEKSVDSAGVEPKLLNALAETEKRRLILVTRLLQRLGIRTIIEEEAIPSVTMCHIYSTRSLVSYTDCKYEETTTDFANLYTVLLSDPRMECHQVS